MIYFRVLYLLSSARLSLIDHLWMTYNMSSKTVVSSMHLRYFWIFFSDMICCIEYIMQIHLLPTAHLTLYLPIQLTPYFYSKYCRLQVQMKPPLYNSMSLMTHFTVRVSWMDYACLPHHLQGVPQSCHCIIISHWLNNYF